MVKALAEATTVVPTVATIAPAAPAAAPAAPAMNNGWGPVQPGMSSANGPKGTVFQPGNGGNNNPLSAPGATVYMPSK